VDWLRRTGAPFVLVARSGLGTLNHTLLSLEVLRARHLVPRAILLLGDKHTSNASTLRELANGTPVLEVPRFEQLNVESLDRWLADPHGDGPRLGEVLSPH
jgi:dethiobiotin synthetase